MSINVPSETSQKSIYVTGVAPPEKSVRILVYDTQVAETMANKAGVYTCEISLENMIGDSNRSYFTIKAISHDNENKEISAESGCKYETNLPYLTDFKMVYKGKDYDFLIDGVPQTVPSISFSKNYSYHFSITFKNPNRIKDVYVVSEKLFHSTKTIKAERLASYENSDEATFETHDSFDFYNSDYIPGKLNVYYTEIDSINDFSDSIMLSDDAYNSMFDGATAEVLTDTSSKSEFKVTFNNGISSTFNRENYDIVNGMKEMLGEAAYNSISDSINAAIDGSNGSELADVLVTSMKSFGFSIIKSTGKDGLERIITQEFENGGKNLITYTVDLASDLSSQVITKAVMDMPWTDTLDLSQYTFSDKSTGYIWNEALGIFQNVADYAIVTSKFDVLREKVNASDSSESDKEKALIEIESSERQENAAIFGKALRQFADNFVDRFGSLSQQLELYIVENSLDFARATLEDICETYLDANCPTYGNKFHIGSTFDAKPKFTIDPSGYVYEGVTSNRLLGVKATAYYIPYDETDESFWDEPKTENAIIWDASEYDQQNPVYTDIIGEYAWDVPEGWWCVKYELDGYKTTYSDWLPVPPPQLDVNVEMISNAKPNVTEANLTSNGIQVIFDRYIDPSSFDNIIVKGVNGESIAYSIEYSKDETNADGKVFAKSFLLKLLDEHNINEVLSIEIPNTVTSYSGVKINKYFKSFDTISTNYGDLNNDAKVNLTDLILMRKYLAKWSVSVNIQAADCNADGNINLLDLVLLRKYLAKWSVVLGPQK